jgi:hypothetical protein
MGATRGWSIVGAGRSPKVHAGWKDYCRCSASCLAQLNIMERIPMIGGDPVQLTKQRSVEPAISRDGKWLAWLFAGGGPHSIIDSIGIMSVNGGPPVRVLPLPRMLLDMEGVLQWTPDGSGVVYVETNGGVSNLYAQPVNGGTPHALTNFTEDHIIYIAWSSDWKRLP